MFIVGMLIRAAIIYCGARFVMFLFKAIADHGY